MGSIHVTTVLLVVKKTPAELLGVLLLVHPVLTPERVEVVNVSALSVEHLTQQALLSHVEGVELEPVVAAVLQNHAVLAGLLGQVNELPALLQVHGAGHLDSGVLAILQSALSYGEVVIHFLS